MLAKYKHIIIYGFSLAILLFLMKWLEYRFIIIDHALEIYIGAIAVIFTSLGIWLALKLSSPKVKTIKVKEEVYIYGNEHFTLNQVTLLKLNLSKRELEVLQLMAQGLSNQEIAGHLFVS